MVSCGKGGVAAHPSLRSEAHIATLLLIAEEKPKVVSERLGHASIAVTMDLYSHVLPSMQDDAASAMGALFERAAVSS